MHQRNRALQQMLNACPRFPGAQIILIEGQRAINRRRRRAVALEMIALRLRQNVFELLQSLPDDE